MKKRRVSHEKIGFFLEKFRQFAAVSAPAGGFLPLGRAFLVGTHFALVFIGLLFVRQGPLPLGYLFGPLGTLQAVRLI